MSIAVTLPYGGLRSGAFALEELTPKPGQINIRVRVLAARQNLQLGAKVRRTPVSCQMQSFQFDPPVEEGRDNKPRVPSGASCSEGVKIWKGLVESLELILMRAP